MLRVTLLLFVLLKCTIFLEIIKVLLSSIRVSLASIIANPSCKVRSLLLANNLFKKINNLASYKSTGM